MTALNADEAAMFLLIVLCLISSLTLVGILFWYLSSRRLAVLATIIGGYLLATSCLFYLSAHAQWPKLDPSHHIVLTTPLG
jgi:hypothetical protein